MLSENNELIIKNQGISNTFNDYFGSVVENLELFQWNEHNGISKMYLALKKCRNYH